LKVFKEIDVEEQGYLTLEDLACYLTDFGYSNEEMIDLFLRLDVDHDDIIQPEEFVAKFGEWNDTMMVHL